MRKLGSLLQLVGLVAVAVGGFLLVPWLGVVAGGVGVFAVGYQLEALHTPGGDG